MTKTKFKKYHKNRLKPIKKYLIYKAILGGRTIREISKEFKCSVRTIIEIKRKSKQSLIPFLEIDNLGYLIYEIKEQNPFFTFKDIQNYLKEHYKIKVSISTISNKLKNYCLYSEKYMNEDILELFKKLIEDNEIKMACEILKHYKLNLRDYYLLEKLPDDYLPVDIFVKKIIYLIENEKLSEDEILNYQRKLEVILSNYQKVDLNYYYLLLLKVYFLVLFSEFDKAFEIYNQKKDEIEKLPLNLRVDILLLFSNLFLLKYPREALRIISKLKRIKKFDLREDLFRLYLNLGYLNKAKGIFSEPILDFLMGNYRKFIKEVSKFLDKIEDAQTKTYYKSLLMESKILNNIPISIISKEIEKEVEKYPFYQMEFKGCNALKFAILGDYEKVKELLSDELEKSNIIKAILTKNYKILSKYRKQELLVKYLIKGNLKRAIEVARKYGLFHNLHLYS
ncbi:MAG: hypothetical protein ABIL76_08720, partial [candidate division WOR-3 bacterium]